MVQRSRLLSTFQTISFIEKLVFWWYLSQFWADFENLKTKIKVFSMAIQLCWLSDRITLFNIWKMCKKIFKYHLVMSKTIALIRHPSLLFGTHRYYFLCTLKSKTIALIRHHHYYFSVAKMSFIALIRHVFTSLLFGTPEYYDSSKNGWLCHWSSKNRLYLYDLSISDTLSCLPFLFRNIILIFRFRWRLQTSIFFP